MKKDTRPIVLYLRSFQDDSKIKIRARAANGRILLERLVKIPFEEVVTDHLWGYGPVLAIGNPQMKSKPALLGAARDYVDDSTWQQKVSDLIHDAAMIVVVAGGTEGLAWEIDTIARLGSIWKLVLLFPPVNVHELQTRWQALASHVRENILPAQIDFAQARAVIFPKGQPVLITGTKGDDWTYEAALDEAALTIASERHSNHPAASPERALRAGRVREVLGRVASDLASMLAAAFMLVLFVVAYAASQHRESITRPFASDSDQRKQFMAEMMRVCRENNSQLSAERLANYCSCFTNDLADVVTLSEINKVDTNPSAFQSKVKSVSGACSEKTLGQ